MSRPNMKLFRKLRGAAPPPPAADFDEPISPNYDFFAIGDIHGQIADLTRAIQMIREQTENPRIVCVGDFIDRGDNSADVLRYLMDLSALPYTVCLMGNHEDMCLKFLDDPEKYGDRWLRNGGLQTLASFRIGLDPDKNIYRTRDALAAAMGDDMIAWLRARPYYWVTGNIAVTHAGADPDLPIGRQPTRNLIWGHADFATVPRTDGMWVLHGHTIVDDPCIVGRSISIDTGAYATGRLTVALVTPGQVSFQTA